MSKKNKSNLVVQQSEQHRRLAKFYGPLPEEKFEPIQVKINSPQDRMSFENALKKFKLLFQKERVLGELKLRSAYEKPCEKKRRKKKEAAERKFLTEAKERLIASGEWDRIQKRKAKRRQQKLENKAFSGAK